jgi:predicted Ser/Thr protein kinase
MSIHKKTIIKDRSGITYTFREDKPRIVASNSIYVSEENPEIYIKVIKHPSLLEHSSEHAFIKGKIEHELKTAKMLSNNFLPVPHVYYTKIDVDNEYITGYIVMDRIKGRIISSQKVFDRYFDKILTVLNDLLEIGIIYEDMNINNFIIGEDDEVYVIDFEETVPLSNDSRVVKRTKEGTLSLNETFIETNLRKSIEVRKKYRMDGSPKSSPRKHKNTKKSHSRSPGKTAKRSPSQSP